MIHTVELTHQQRFCRLRATAIELRIQHGRQGGRLKTTVIPASQCRGHDPVVELEAQLAELRQQGFVVVQERFLTQPESRPAALAVQPPEWFV